VFFLRTYNLLRGLCANMDIHFPIAVHKDPSLELLLIP